MAGARVWSFCRLCLVASLALYASSRPSLGQEAPSLIDNADSVALVIGIKSYRKTVPVDFADNDAKAMHEYLVKGLGFRDANIIMLDNATRNDLDYELGTDANPQGDLFNRVQAGKSNVFVYYSGHGIPDVTTKRSFLLPADGYPNSSGSGYALETLYRNLELVKQKVGDSRQVVVMIDACFTGESGRKGQKLLEMSAPGLVPVRPTTGSGIIKLVATSGAMPSNWDDKNRLGLFTSRFLMGVGGLAAGDKPGGPLLWSALRGYVTREVAESARLEVQREQVPEIDDAPLTLPTTPPVAAVSTAVGLVRDDVNWRAAHGKATREAYEAYVGDCGPSSHCAHRQEALDLLKEADDKVFRAADKQNWERLSKDGKYQDYLDGCRGSRSCAFRDIAEGHLKLRPKEEVRAPPPSPAKGPDPETEFMVAQALNTIDAYRSLLSRFPDHPRRGEILQAIRKLVDLNAKEHDETMWIDALGKQGDAGIASLRHYMATFPEGIHAAEAKQRIATLSVPSPTDSPRPDRPGPTDDNTEHPVKWFDGKDLPGNDLGPWIRNVRNVDACMDACRSRDGCVAFTYNMTRLVCIPKYRVGVPVFVSPDRAVSAALVDAPGITIVRPKIDYFPDLDAPYNDRGRWIYHSSQQSCEDQCIADAGCAGYTINLTKNVCILKNAIGRLETPVRDRALTAVMRR